MDVKDFTKKQIGIKHDVVMCEAISASRCRHSALRRGTPLLLPSAPSPSTVSRAATERTASCAPRQLQFPVYAMSVPLTIGYNPGLPV